ncbi:hypothetical protein Tco_1243161 [Tanacetum coccineum]
MGRSNAGGTPIVQTAKGLHHRHLVAYTDSDYAGATQDRKSTTGGYISTDSKSAKATTDDNREVQITAIIDGHSMTITEDNYEKTSQMIHPNREEIILCKRVQEKASTKTKPIIQEVTPTEVIQDQGSSEKGNSEVSTAGATKEERTRKDKGKAKMTEPEPKKKSKKELEQERLSFAEAIRMQEQMNEEQRAKIARDEEIARQWDEEERQRAKSEAKPIFEKVWDFNQHIEPMDLEHGSERMKSPEKVEEEDVDTQNEMR